MAEQTGLEPATPGVTGRYSNQLNYCSAKLVTPCEVGAIILMHLDGVNSRLEKNITFLPLAQSLFRRGF